MLYASVDAWKPFGLGCAVFRRAVCGRALCAARSGHDVHDGALAGGIPALHRAGEPFGRTAQMEHPVAAAGASRVVRIGVWLVFHTVPELAYCAGYLAVGYGFWGAGWGMKRRRQRRGRQGPNKDFQ